MHLPKPVSERELREELLSLAEEFQMDVLLLECLAQADLSDCCEDVCLEPLYRRVRDYVQQHARDISHLAERV